jgi:tRNA pseudouridine38-40 synthase
VNIKVVLEYDGTAFAGWQQQTGHRTVESELKRSLRELTGLDHKVQAAGRTDAGAHALGQVVNFDFLGRIPPQRLLPALNARLPEDVSTLACEVVADDFQSRYQARWRRYRYRYLDRPARPAVDRYSCWHLPRRLDVEAMSAAARQLVGKHDWTSFCAASEPPEARLRFMREASVKRIGRFVDLELVAEGFLRGLVRGIAGALAEVGLGRRPVGWLGELLGMSDRSRGARTAPARGLTLMEVIY